jgi:hypothetical protein
VDDHIVLGRLDEDVQAVTGQHAVTRPRLWPLVLAAALVILGVFYVVVARYPTAYACNPTDPGCVVVTASAPGGPGNGGGSSDPGGGGGTSKPDPCAKYPGQLYTYCKNNVGTMCLDLYNQFYNTMPLAQFNQLMAANACPQVAAGAAPPSPATLAQQAADSMLLPVPTPERYPAARLQDGRPYTVVGAWTWYWTDASKWKSYTATASAGGIWATVMAEPVSLSFTPGDGNAAASCAGPGSVWRQGVNGPWDPSPSGCQYRYPYSSIHEPNQVVTATYTITWQLTWTGSGNTSGTLTAKTTQATATFAVAEVESVVTH